MVVPDFLVVVPEVLRLLVAVAVPEVLGAVLAVPEVLGALVGSLSCSLYPIGSLVANLALRLDGLAASDCGTSDCTGGGGDD